MESMNSRRHLAAAAVLLVLTACNEGRDADDTLGPVPTDSAVGSASPVADTVASTPPSTSAAPSTAPTNAAPITVAPITVAPTTVAPATVAPITVAPTTVAPATVAPTTVAPATVAPATVAPSEPPPAASSITLRADGIAGVDFGADPDSAIAAVQSALGDASEDSGWVAPFTISACPGTEYRRVSWGALALQFSDATSAADGRRHFFGYEYGLVGQTDAEPAGLTTPEGIGIGSTVADLRQAYPDVSIAPGEQGVSSPAFEVTEGGLAGLLTDASDGGIVMVLVGGDFCGG